MFRAVGFDLDDTLAVTARDRTTLLREACERVGSPALEREAYLAAHDADLADETRAPIFETVLDDHATDVAPTDLAAAYREVVNEALVPVDGAAELVRDLRREYRVGLLTDGPRRAQRSKLGRLGWADLFDAVVVTGDLEAGKPDVHAFEALLAALGGDLAPGDVVYVGDRPVADVAGANSAGMVAVQVLGPDDEPHPAAAATVERAAIADRLPDVLADLAARAEC